MARLVTITNAPADCEIALTSDWHMGSRAFHAKALDQLVEWVLAEKHRYLGFGGDAVEGKPVGSPHFDPEALVKDEQTIGRQFQAVCDKIRPIKKRILWWGMGNHDIYLSRDVNVVEAMVCRPLGILDRMGDYQTWVDLGHFRVHVYHGRSVMPRGAKDPIQREANQRAWLVNRLSPLAGDCLVQLMGHVHALLVQPPIEAYALLCKGTDVRARYFREPKQAVTTRDHEGIMDQREFIPVLSRWYACTGTLRRSGGFGYTDYAEVAGYAPAPIGWAKMTVKGKDVVNIEKVVV